jgi:hypothetical protein
MNWTIVNKRLEYYWSKFPLLLSSLLVAAASLTGVLFRPEFQTIDDQGLILAFSGTLIFDSPTAVTAFTSKIWGLINVLLYENVPNLFIEPYVLLLYVVAFFSLLFLSFSVIKSSLYSFKSFCLLAILGIWVFIPFFNKIQFTTISALAIFAGCYGIIKSGKGLSWSLSYGLILLLLGYLIRPSNIYVILPISFVYVYLNDALNKGLWITFRNQIAKFIIACLAVFFVSKIDYSIHNTSERNFINFNTFRVYMNDFHILPEKDDTKNIVKENSKRDVYLNNMKPEGIELFQNWFYSHPLLFNNQIDYNLLNKDVSIFQILSLNRIRHNFLSIKKVVIVDLLASNIPIVLSIVFFIFILSGKNVRTAIIINLVLLIVMYIFLSTFTKPVPYRLSFVMFFMTFFFIIMKVISSEDFFSKNVSTNIIVIMLFMSCLYVGMDKWPLRTWKYKEISLNLDNDNFYFMHHALPGYLNFDPLHFREGLKINGKVLCSGSFSVLENAHRLYKGKKFSSFVDFSISNISKVIYLLPPGVESEAFKQSYVNFILAHYGVSVVFDNFKGEENQFILKERSKFE